MNHKRFILSLAALLGAVFACNAPVSPSSPSTNLPSDLVVDLPQTGPDSPQDQAVTPTPTTTIAPPTDTIPAPPTDTISAPTDTPPPPPSVPSIYFPSGFMAAASDASSVTVYDLNGGAVTQINTPGMSSGTSSNMHFGGNVWNGIVNGPLAFVSFEDQGKIKQNLNGQISDLIPGPDIVNLSGGLGKNIFVFNNVWVANETLATQLYVFNPAAGGSNLVHEWWDPDFTAIFPMGIDLDGLDPQGIWYTFEPWGIGGDIVFPPREGLLYLDFNTQSETLLLALGFNPVGFSPDKSVVAYTPTDSSYINEPNPSLKIYNIPNGTINEILLLDSSDRGAGYAALSPDNRYIAWMEASGWQMAEVPTFTSRVRIADMSGNPLADIPVSTLASVTGVVNPTLAKPVGWLDAENLIVEIRGDSWNNPHLVKIRFDGSGLTYLSTGSFGGFVYP